jgi:hypothetical protein
MEDELDDKVRDKGGGGGSRVGTRVGGGRCSREATRKRVEKEKNACDRTSLAGASPVKKDEVEGREELHHEAMAVPVRPISAPCLSSDTLPRQDAHHPTPAVKLRWLPYSSRKR